MMLDIWAVLRYAANHITAHEAVHATLIHITAHEAMYMPLIVSKAIPMYVYNMSYIQTIWLTLMIVWKVYWVIIYCFISYIHPYILEHNIVH